jgi:nucleoside-diphosphate-sugar epimerase
MTEGGTRKKIIVTGGSGFIGTNSLDYFLRERYEVLNIDRGRPINPAHGPYWKECDILDLKRLVGLFQEFAPQYLIHLAARTDLAEKKTLRGYTSNIEGVSNVIEASRQTPSIRRAIFASSRMVCRIGYRPAHDEDYCPVNYYGESKVQSEQLVRKAVFEFPWVLVRPTSIWGPWFGVPYRLFFLSIARGTYFNPGNYNPIKSFGYVGNTVRQLARLLEADAMTVGGRSIYLCDPPLRVLDWAEEIRREMGRPPIRKLPYGALQLLALAGDVLKTVSWFDVPLTTFRLKNLIADMTFDTTLLESVCGAPEYDVKQGTKTTIEWMRRAGLCA